MREYDGALENTLKLERQLAPFQCRHFSRAIMKNDHDGLALARLRNPACQQEPCDASGGSGVANPIRLELHQQALDSTPMMKFHRPGSTVVG